LRECFLIVDFSSRNVQADFIDCENGQLLDSKFSTYAPIQKEPGWNELNPNDIWESSQKVVSEIIKSNNGICEVTALGFSFFGDNLVLADVKGNPFENLILSFDYRAKDEAQKLTDEFGEEKLFRLVGYEPVGAGLIPAKILWLQKYKPQIFTNETQILNLQQYIFLKLGLGIVTDYSLACRKNIYDMHKMGWSDTLCDYLNIHPAQLGEKILPANTIIGRIKEYGEVKFSKAIPVLLGAHNSVSGMVGLGSLPNNRAILTEVVGTFDVIGSLTDTLQEKYTGFLAIYCGPFKDSFVIAGSSIGQPDLEWGLKTIYQEERFSTILSKLRNCPFDGNNTVILTKSIQTGDGAIRGVNLNTTKEDILQAIMEGGTFPLIGIVSQLSRMNNNKIDLIRCGGRAAFLNEQFLQMKADMYNLVVEKTKNNHASSLGAAIFLAVELGYFTDYISAMESMISIEEVYKPRAEIAQRYKQRYLDFLDAM